MVRVTFNSLHYMVDRYFYAAKFPRFVGGIWEGADIGLEKYGAVGRFWYSVPPALKWIGGTLTNEAAKLTEWHQRHNK